MPDKAQFTKTAMLAYFKLLYSETFKQQILNMKIFWDHFRTITNVGPFWERNHPI